MKTVKGNFGHLGYIHNLLRQVSWKTVIPRHLMLKVGCCRGPAMSGLESLLTCNCKVMGKILGKNRQFTLHVGSQRIFKGY